MAYRKTGYSTEVNYLEIGDIVTLPADTYALRRAKTLLQSRKQDCLTTHYNVTPLHSVYPPEDAVVLSFGPLDDLKKARAHNRLSDEFEAVGGPFVVENVLDDLRAKLPPYIQTQVFIRPLNAEGQHDADALLFTFSQGPALIDSVKLNEPETTGRMNRTFVPA